QRAGGFRLRREIPEDAVCTAEIAWDEGGVVIAAKVPAYAPVRLAQERADVGGNGANRARTRHITQGHVWISNRDSGNRGDQPTIFPGAIVSDTALLR